MSRSLTAEITDSISKTVARPFFAVDLEFDSPNQLYLWSGLGDLTVGATTYTGAGTLMNVSEVRESADIAANNANISLSGIPADLISIVLAEPYQNRTCRIKFGLLDYSLVEDSYLLLEDGTGYVLLEDGGRIDISQSAPASLFTLFEGTMDQMIIRDGGQSIDISLSVESKLVDLERSAGWRYTDASHQARYSGDLAFEFVSRLQTESLTWGS